MMEGGGGPGATGAGRGGGMELGEDPSVWVYFFPFNVYGTDMILFVLYSLTPCNELELLI